LDLEAKKRSIYRLQEEAWCLKSQATWVAAGYKNSKFSHRFVSIRRSENSIWRICDDGDNIHTTQSDIDVTSFNHFKGLFIAKDLSAQAQLDFINHMPRLIQETRK